jgi:hypothetical protein
LAEFDIFVAELAKMSIIAANWRRGYAGDCRQVWQKPLREARGVPLKGDDYRENERDFRRCAKIRHCFIGIAGTRGTAAIFYTPVCQLMSYLLSLNLRT